MRESELRPLEDLFRTEYVALVRVARALLDDTSASEEVVQEAFVRCLARWPSAAPRNGAAYLRTTTLNLARSRLRRRKLRPLRETEAGRRLISETPETVGYEVDELDRLRAAIARLPRRQREATLLHFVAGLTMREVSIELGVSESTVKSHIHRALGALEKKLNIDQPKGTHV